MNLRYFGFLGFFVLTGVVSAQSINSPYSGDGLGEIAYEGLGHNFGMGETGIGMPTLWHVNLQNPALLIYNGFSTFQLGVTSDIRNQTSNFGKSRDNSAALRYVAMSFPVKRGKWTSSFAILPVSTVNYNTYSQDSLDENTVGITRFQGSGGLSQFVWANGVKLSKGLSLGVKAAYLFGAINRTSNVQLESPNDPATYIIAYNEETSYSDFNFSLGLAYRWSLSNENFINLGSTYNLSRQLNGTEDRYFERLRGTGNSIQGLVISENVQTSFTLPQAFGFGVSYEKLNVLRIGADLETRSWQSNNGSTSEVALRNTFSLSTGGEWIPNYQDVNNYFSRASYRFGFSFKQSPYLVNNTQINDFGINFGASFPVSGYSSLDAALKLGQRGTTDNNLIREEYFQVTIGATINDNNWFIKRRYD